ncbi:CoA-disulfide reductase [Candidatus Syntrophocurvum alkaliphilum]|uniref:CoA-disulfide reductase n=1 Tax=Candidatus Syntrophocurvum alkaliphilum TaxID=2293317 RepID=A0A6I6DF19_9FIRM|nr:CoA-disulfide reductase [Candidatus Syntrophocurvum alkaliphilum]QGT99098.1 CoA-disulfide reductase [Candidatus Syntrophocurvum alkaliphilum]
MGKKILIVGGVAAGASAAARLRRIDEFAEIIVFEKGEHISFANCGLPYYVGGVIEKRKRLLVQTPNAMMRRFKIDIRVFNEVVSIQPDAKEVEVQNLNTGEKYREKYDYLVLSPGASAITPPITGIDKPNVFTVRDIPDSDTIKSYIQNNNPSNATIIGGGFIGLEMAEMLHFAGLNVSVIEAAPQIMQPLDIEMAAIVNRYLISNGINLYLNSKVASFKGQEYIDTVVLENEQEINTDLIVLGMGVKPNSKLAKDANLEIGETGGILVNEYLQTSNPYIYAAGDAIQVKDFVSGYDTHIPLAGPANRQGWIVANNIVNEDIKYKGVQGTSIVKIFDMVVASTGLNEKTLKKLGIDFIACHTHPSSRATYYPGATDMSLKLLFTPDKGKILGAQIVGYDGVDKRIDVLATAIRANMTVSDLQELELSYAPPFSSAKDPVNMLGYVASNIIKNNIKIVYWDEVAEKLAQGAILLDVRTTSEVEAGTVEKSYNIPLDSLRDRIKELPSDKEILVYCQQGLRSYIANRILLQNGYNCKNISGGYRSYLPDYI